MRRKTINSFQLFLLVIVKNKEVICSLIGAIFSLATVSLRGGKKSRHKGNTAINVEKVLWYVFFQYYPSKTDLFGKSFTISMVYINLQN